MLVSKSDEMMRICSGRFHQFARRSEFDSSLFESSRIVFTFETCALLSNAMRSNYFQDLGPITRIVEK